MLINYFSCSISCLDSAKKNWIALEVDTGNDSDKASQNTVALEFRSDVLCRF